MSYPTLMETRRVRSIFLEALSHLISINKLPIVPYSEFKISSNKSTKEQIKTWLNVLQSNLVGTRCTLKIAQRFDKRIIRHPYFKYTDTAVCFKDFLTGVILGDVVSNENEEFLIMEISNDVPVIPSIATHHVGLKNLLDVVWISRKDPTEVTIVTCKTEEEVETLTGLCLRHGKLYKKHQLTSLCIPYFG